MNENRKRSPNILGPGIVILIIALGLYYFRADIKNFATSFTVPVQSSTLPLDSNQVLNPDQANQVSGIQTVIPDVVYLTPTTIDAVAYPATTTVASAEPIIIPAINPSATPGGPAGFPPNGANISLDDLLLYLKAVGQDTAYVACSPDAINGSIPGWPNAVPVQMNVNTYLVDFTPIMARVYEPNLCQWRTENGKNINGMNIFMTSITDVSPQGWPWITYNGWLFTPFN